MGFRVQGLGFRGCTTHNNNNDDNNKNTNNFGS